MKKLKLLGIMVFAFAMMLGLKTTVLAADGSLSIQASANTVNPGDEVKFTISVKNGDEGVSGAQGDIKVSENLQYNGYTLGTDSGTPSVSSDGSSFSFAGNSTDRKGKDFVITFNYKVKEDAVVGEKVTFELSNALAYGTTLNERGYVTVLSNVNNANANSEVAIVEKTTQSAETETTTPQTSGEANTPTTQAPEKTNTNTKLPKTGDINLSLLLATVLISGLGVTFVVKKIFN